MSDMSTTGFWVTSRILPCRLSFSSRVLLASSSLAFFRASLSSLAFRMSSSLAFSRNSLASCFSLFISLSWRCFSALMSSFSFCFRCFVVIRPSAGSRGGMRLAVGAAAGGGVDAGGGVASGACSGISEAPSIARKVLAPKSSSADWVK